MIVCALMGHGPLRRIKSNLGYAHVRELDDRKIYKRPPKRGMVEKNLTLGEILQVHYPHLLRSAGVYTKFC